MVQGLVNSRRNSHYGLHLVAAVKIDAFAYMPVQDFGNAFLHLMHKNYGAKEKR